jgi:hypothetical protein
MLIKLGTRPGTPARLQLTETEIAMFDTDTAMQRKART